MKMALDYGLELTSNSKVGWAFSLPRTETCINATSLCRKLCYGNSVRYQSVGAKAKRRRNFRTCEFLLAEGGPELLAENLSVLVDQARPRDYLIARITGGKTKIPFTLRLQDVGDFYSVDYVRAWFLTAKKHSECKFWFYTRSFIDAAVFAELTKLASLPNCQGWLSVDSENFEEAILALCKAPSGVWKLALLQDKDLHSGIIPAFESLEARVDIVNFPYHRSGRHVEPVRHSMLTSCPAVVGSLALQPQKDSLRPCQACTFCLP
ncbi:MAG: hypothetical protein K2Y32_20700 [Candidatus Obscuribacterales bacterium]|nr:hypothetical protein [Candidatus Obscuribacterales bacterium]